MRTRRATFTVLVLAFALLAPALTSAQGATGTWNATWETRIGEQRYTFRLEQRGQTLTGTATSNFGEAKIEDGRVTGNVITFTETLTIEGTVRQFEYSGTLAADKIAFVRDVFDGNKNKITTEKFEATKTR